MAALFTALTIGLALLAVWAGEAGEWVIAVAGAAIAAWLATVAWSAVRRLRS